MCLYINQLDTVRTEDETTKKSFGKPRKNPPTHDTSSYLFEGNKTGDASQPSATAEQLNTIGGGSKQDSFSQGAITGMVANQSQVKFEMVMH